MVYISGVNKDGIATIKRTNPDNCLIDDLVARVRVSRAVRWISLYNYLFGRVTSC